MARVLAPLRLSALAFAALVWALAPLGTALHAGGHPHRYCPEHGAFEEGTSVAPTPSADSPPPGWSASTAATDVAGHVLCPFAITTMRGTARAVSAAEVAALPGNASLRMEWRSHHATIQHLSLAPKSSPPSVSDVVVEA